MGVSGIRRKEEGMESSMYIYFFPNALLSAKERKKKTKVDSGKKNTAHPDERTNFFFSPRERMS